MKFDLTQTLSFYREKVGTLQDENQKTAYQQIITLLEQFDQKDGLEAAVSSLKEVAIGKQREACTLHALRREEAIKLVSYHLIMQCCNLLHAIHMEAFFASIERAT